MRAAPIAVGCCVAIAAMWYGLAGVSPQAAEQIHGEGAFVCAVASITDGDTFRCDDGTRVRLAGVDARERDGSCGRGHPPCVAASAESATAALSGLALGQRLQCQANGTSYNRVAAFCRRPDGTDLSCAMLAGHFVAIWPRYWGGHRC